MKKHILLIVFILLLSSSAFAQLSGVDTQVGDDCSSLPTGATRLNASAAQNGANTVMICDGSQWTSASGTVTAPPSCTGANRALQWDGSAWICATVDALTECRVCVQHASNSSADGTKRCTSYSKDDIEQISSYSQWAEGTRYATRVWIQCR